MEGAKGVAGSIGWHAGCVPADFFAFSPERRWYSTGVEGSCWGVGEALLFKNACISDEQRRSQSNLIRAGRIEVAWRRRGTLMAGLVKVRDDAERLR